VIFLDLRHFFNQKVQYKHALTNALPLIWLTVLALWETHTNAVAAFELGFFREKIENIPKNKDKLYLSLSHFRFSLTHYSGSGSG
jgi:hypothetical protein